MDPDRGVQNRLLYAQQLRQQHRQSQAQAQQAQQGRGSGAGTGGVALPPGGQGLPGPQGQQGPQSLQTQRFPPNTLQMAPNSYYTLGLLRQRKEAARQSIADRYTVLGYIAAGTYGKVYKACRPTGTLEARMGGSNAPPSNSSSANGARDPNEPLYAIKKFKSDAKDSQAAYHTGISQSAIREMSLCREMSHHRNISGLVEIILERKCIFMVFEYAEYDLLQIIHNHSHPGVGAIPRQMLKSTMAQVLAGVAFLHENWVLHRDLKPANIMVTRGGVVKVGDLGLARRFDTLPQSLYAGDKVVVTIWYRAPELLLGAKHYTPAVDLWSIGCILGEMVSLRPIFKGEEAKMEAKKHMPFQENQLLKILEVLGTPSPAQWPDLGAYPEYPHMARFTLFPSNLKAWYGSHGGGDEGCFELLSALLTYDPIKRVNARAALDHAWFTQEPKPADNVFQGVTVKYPKRKIHKDDTDILGRGQIPGVGVQGQQAAGAHAHGGVAAAAAGARAYKRNYDLMTTTAQLRSVYDTKRKR